MSYLDNIRFTGSLVLHRVLRGYFNFMYHNIISRLSNDSWKLLVEKFKVPGSLIYVMLNAPRWNTHALVATLGPFKVEEVIRFSNLSDVTKNCQSWTVVVYEQPSNRTVAFFSSFEIQSDEHTLNLPSGKYAIGMRCYEGEYPLSLPVVMIDKSQKQIRRIISSKPEYYPSRIFGKKSKFFETLQLYSHLALSGRVKKNEEFVKNEYLPVGNPETEFTFGTIMHNETKCLDFSDIDFDKYLLYVTRYNSSSFPIESKRLTGKKIELKAQQELQSYLIRKVRKTINS